MWRWPLRGLQNLLSLSLENTSWNEFLLILERCPWCMKPNADTTTKEGGFAGFPNVWCALGCIVFRALIQAFLVSNATVFLGLAYLECILSVLHWQWRVGSWLESVYPLTSSMLVGAATGIHFLIPLYSRISSLSELISAPPVSEQGLGRVF